MANQQDIYGSLDRRLEELNKQKSENMVTVEEVDEWTEPAPLSSSSSPPAASVPGTLHYIPPNLSAFEPSKTSSDGHTQPESINTIIWIGGLLDSPLSIAYPLVLARALGADWSLVTASLSSSGFSFGVFNLAQDVLDISKIVKYIKQQRPRGKIVLMGHSTGCQDCMMYLSNLHDFMKLPQVDGVVLQAPVSDREALAASLPPEDVEEINNLALEWYNTRNQPLPRKSDDVLPNRYTRQFFGKAAVTAERWVTLASPDHKSHEDMFSSDLSDERLDEIFGGLRQKVPILVLYSGSDEHVPSTIDKAKLIQRWFSAYKKAGGVPDETNGGIVPGASHNLNTSPAEVREELVSRVLRYLEAYHK